MIKTLEMDLFYGFGYWCRANLKQLSRYNSILSHVK